MFLYDKDMERVMLAKKKEVVAEIEAHKKRVLEELLCVKRSVHTDFCGLLADYNRISVMLKDRITEMNAEIDTAINSFRDYMSDHYREHSETLTRFETIVSGKVAELEEMQVTVNSCIEQLEELLSNGVTMSDLNALKEELMAEMENAGAQSDWNESDPESAAFVKNRTHYGVLTNTSVWEKANGTSITRTGRHTVSDINQSTWPRYAAKWYDMNFDVPANCNKVVLTSKDSSNGEVVFELSRLTGRFVFFDKNSNPVIHETTIYGEPTNGIISFIEDIEGYHFILAYMPDIGKWRLYSNYDLNLYGSYSIVTSSGSVEKEIAPEYLAKDGFVGSVLANAGDHNVWTAMPGTSVNVVEFTDVINWNLDYSRSDESYHYFSYNHEQSAQEVYDLLGERGTEFYVTAIAGGKTVVNRIGTRRPVTGSADLLPYISVNTSNNSVTCKVYTSSFTTEEVQNGINIIASTYKSYIKRTTFAADDIAENPVDGATLCVDGGLLVWRSGTIVTSPNGTKFSISVSDDGTLSATPITQ